MVIATPCVPSTESTWPWTCWLQALLHMHKQPCSSVWQACCCAARLVLPVCRFAFGGSGVFFGGKDVFISEVTGGFSVTADGHGTNKDGVPTARLIVQVGNTNVIDPQR